MTRKGLDKNGTNEASSAVGGGGAGAGGAVGATARVLAAAGAQLVRDAAASLRGAERAGVATGDTRFVPPEPPEPKDEVERLDGWGFADTRFTVKPGGAVMLTGKRYSISNVELPKLLGWMGGMIASPLAYENKHESAFPPAVPPPRAHPELLAALREILGDDQIQEDDATRLRHGHGQTGEEIWKLRYGSLPRVPDVVVFPDSHDEVVALVELAKRTGTCLIPFGGGTNVTDALRCDPTESRIIVSVDMRRMNKILWIDPVNRMACIQAGAAGRHIVRELERYKLTMGHEPDSVEFSTLGGWIATNASGMKKNRYGNIEDIVVDMQVVTTGGVIGRHPNVDGGGVAPRESVGVNPAELMFGSEGNYGIITTATVKLFPVPELQRYGSVIFPDLQSGFDFLYDLQKSGAVPASVRLMDNTQFHFGQALKPASEGFAAWKSKLEAQFVTQVKRFDPLKLAVATLVFEGTKEEVAYQEAIVNRLAKERGGLQGGAGNGERGYQLTFGIAYIRDLTFDHWVIAESFETSAPWSRALDLYERVRIRVTREHELRRLPGKVFFTGRFTQVYATGVAIYFYLGFYAQGVADPIGEYAALERAAREEILAAGGSLSHHHGVGKLRQGFMKDIYAPGSLLTQERIKHAVDPENVFGAKNHGVLGQVDLHAQT